MTMQDYFKIYTKKMEEAGTYKPYYDSTIETLAEISVRIDTLRAEYEKEGSNAIINKTSDRGSVNPSRNPKLQLIMDSQKQELELLKELGLTPKSRNQIKKQEKPSKENTLLKMIKELEEESGYSDNN